jgi:hypothetical protein
MTAKASFASQTSPGGMLNNSVVGGSVALRGIDMEVSRWGAIGTELQGSVHVEGWHSSSDKIIEIEKVESEAYPPYGYNDVMRSKDAQR